MAVRVKICGMTRAEDVAAAVEVGADLLGFNFWPGSKRHVTPVTAARLVGAVPGGVTRVGVFVNASRTEIEDTLRQVPLDAIQLHGDETPEDCAGYAVPVIKALQATATARLAEDAARYPVAFILLDSGGGGQYGGSGETFSWERAAGVAPGRLFLGGGLRPDNVAEAVRRVRPYAVDVASGVESAPGLKDRRKMKELIEHARNA